MLGPLMIAVCGLTGPPQDCVVDPQEQARKAQQEVEASINRWKPGEEARYTPPACILAKSVDLAGEWARTGFHDAYASFRFTARSDGRFDVEFSTWGDLGGWQLNRTARFKDGLVTLNRAVREYVPITYQKMWVVEVGPYRAPVLVPAMAAEDIARAFKAGGCDYFNAVFESFLQLNKLRSRQAEAPRRRPTSGCS